MSVNVLMVPCRFCGAPAGEHCTKSGLPGKCRERLTSIAAHLSRIEAAALAAGYSAPAAAGLVDAAAAGQMRRIRDDWAKTPTGTTPTA